MEAIKTVLPCGEVFYFDKEEWEMDPEADSPVYFREPTSRCTQCSFDAQAMFEDKLYCPADVMEVDVDFEEYSEDE